MSLSMHKTIDSKIAKDLNNHSDIVKENNAQIKKKYGGIVKACTNVAPGVCATRSTLSCFIVCS